MGISGWRRGKLIGRGSSSAVYIATHLSTGQVFSVKSALAAHSASLQREQSLLSSLDSPYLVACLGFDISWDSPSSSLYYNLFLEYAAEGSLSDYVAKKGGRLNDLAIRSITCDILRGLAHLHSRGILHCDVKGRNVLITSEGHALLADLGSAIPIGKRNSDDEPYCRLRGTPVFMAPEVARGQGQGPPADVWALGCTVIEMATGHAPWPDVVDPLAAVHRIAFSQEVPEIPNWLSCEGKDFLTKCLARDPRERWTAEQLLQHVFVNSSSSIAKLEVSPKSTLNQAFWESVPDGDEEADECPATDKPSERIDQLICSSIPDWTWDNIWVTIRSNDGDETQRTGAETISHSFDNDSAYEKGLVTSHCNSCKSESSCSCRVDSVSEQHKREIQIEIWYWLFFLAINRLVSCLVFNRAAVC
ncbi:mitogen-activated protein kinase kinase kinase 17-like [Zingiber officinale]|uniref:Protein kinase domain-containing protein n=1 Tax=Zingiber officinale TaxID=94328 RepID=A0A8J5L9U8_ZINOF|nr:mitogen-activated protein kinase kinase kinase 17-like [Zingiber officinale]KAG6510356.1 hypothetical protein ZIOFF_028366 [Zingiber officinale]